jgi:hypothetical protein
LPLRFFGVDVTEDKETLITYETLKDLVPASTLSWAEG